MGAGTISRTLRINTEVESGNRANDILLRCKEYGYTSGNQLIQDAIVAYADWIDQTRTPPTHDTLKGWMKDIVREAIQEVGSVQISGQAPAPPPRETEQINKAVEPEEEPGYNIYDSELLAGGLDFIDGL